MEIDANIKFGKGVTMTNGQHFLVTSMFSVGSTLREICDTFPEIPAREIYDLLLPPVKEIVSPEDRILRAIFGDTEE